MADGSTEGVALASRGMDETRQDLPDEASPSGLKPGWYPDPAKPGLEQRWTGTYWAEYRTMGEPWQLPSVHSVAQSVARHPFKSAVVVVIAVVVITLQALGGSNQASETRTEWTPVKSEDWMNVECGQFRGNDGNTALRYASRHALYVEEFQYGAPHVSERQIVSTVRQELILLCRGSRGSYRPEFNAIRAAQTDLLL
jgi:hypothetical protein